MKNFRVILCLSLVCLNFISCSRNENIDVLSEGTPLTQIPLSVKDANGIDLLNPNNEVHFSEEKIFFEQIRNGDNIIDKNTKIIKRSNSETYLLLLKTNLSVNNNKSKTVIHWDVNLSDTLEVEFLNGVFKAKRINVNNMPIWHYLQASSLPPTIIK